MLRRTLVADLFCLPALAADADLILHNGKVVTVDAAFRVVEAIRYKERAHHGGRHECRHHKGGVHAKDPSGRPRRQDGAPWPG